MNSLRKAQVSLCCALALAGTNVMADSDWRKERWAVEAFTDALGHGPGTGPVNESSAPAGRVCGDSSGFLFLLADRFVDIVTPEGLRRHLAGNGQPGYRDGPAYVAQFRLRGTSLSNSPNIACATKHEVFVADIGNRRIRRIDKTEGRWRVSTWAGGGQQRLQGGASAAPTAVRLGPSFAIAARSDGSVVVADNHGYYRVDPEGMRMTHLGDWPASTARSEGGAPQLNIVMGDTGPAGNVYFVSRNPDVVVKIDEQGRATHLAGLVVANPPKPHHIGDGPPREAYFDTPSTLVADPNGEAVYVAGGDEYDVRRVPSDGTGTTATLMQNGRWGIASVHPNRSRGAAVYRPNATGRLHPDGELTDLMVCGLKGRDSDGNLYGILFRWKGMTQYVEGEGLLGTRVFRIRRVQDTRE